MGIGNPTANPFQLPKWLTDAGNAVWGGIQYVGNTMLTFNQPKPFMPIQVEGKTVFPTQPGYIDELNKRQFGKTMAAVSLLTGGIAGGVTGAAIAGTGILDLVTQAPALQPKPEIAPVDPHQTPPVVPHVEPVAPVSPAPAPTTTSGNIDPMQSMMNIMMTMMLANMMMSMIPTLSSKRKFDKDEEDEF